MSGALSREREGRALRWVAVVAVLVPAALSLFSRYQQRAFDSYVHMFFADHYARGWFQLWEPRWYGGFAVTSYPPLAHQLVALGSFFLGLEGAYVGVTALAMIATPLISGRLAVAFGEERAGWVAVLVAALLPTTARFAYVYGQLAMITAAPLALWSMYRLDRYLSSARPIDLLTFMFSVGACAGAHHVSTLFVFGGCVLIGARHIVDALVEKRKLLPVLGRGAISAALAGAAVLLVILPFWRFAAGAPQVEIPHFSRDPLWQRPLSLDVVEQVVLGAASLGLMVWAAARRRGAIALACLGALVLLVVSYGDTTPLPRLLFRSQYRWLTYDKFHYWGGLLLAIAAGCAVSTRARPLRLLAALSLAFVPAAVVSISHKLSDEMQPEFVDDVSAIVQVLNQEGAERYRHLFLGFGDQFCRIDVQVGSPNVDGDYHTARPDPVLKQSGIGTLDSAKHYQKGLETLKNVLGRADALSLRWVFITDLWYEPPLVEAGFELREVWPNGVTLFEKATVRPLEPAPLPDSGPLGAMWGLAPLCCLTLCAVCSALSARGSPRSAAAAPAATAAPPPHPAT